ncbi:hypothetical protein OF83DRAFT_1052529 [Amylostereum chailletii]|nr:hypothetical protein OF83DRAFT_1052529 [Amylostereum chailletii]
MHDFGEDFVPFGFSDETEKNKDDEQRGEERRRDKDRDRERRNEREWDRGKGKAGDWDRDAERDERKTRKRKVGDYDPDDGYGNKKQRLDAASRKAPWLENVEWEGCSNVAELLHREVEAFIEYISPTPEEDEVRELTVRMISQAVSKNFPDARVFPFGSYETKLYLPLGDIDLVISKSMEFSDRVTVLHALANTLKRAGITDKVTIIAKAKVPIIKFVTIHGRFAVDISINQANGIQAGKMVNGFLQEMPALRGLVLVTKAFLSQRSMNEVFSGGLGSYSIVCLAISFLQMHPKIRRGEVDPMRNLGVLVMEFFELYGCYFNYQEVGISVRDGGTYFSKDARGWGGDYNKSMLLSIEDPGDISNDISKGSYNMVRVRQTFAGAYNIMAASAFTQAGILSARRSGRTVNLRGHTSQEDMSILASVLGVTQETVNRRKLALEVFDKRTLHRILGVEPKPSVVIDLTNDTPRVNESRKNGASSVKAAWQAADRSDDEPPSRKPPSSQKTPREVINVDADEEESRYGIPPKKRRRLGTTADTHTVFTTDDEEDLEEGELVVHGLTDRDDDSDDSLAREELEYDVFTDDTEPEQAPSSFKGNRSTKDRKRAFWAAKGRRVSPDSSS